MSDYDDDSRVSWVWLLLVAESAGVTMGSSEKAFLKGQERTNIHTPKTANQISTRITAPPTPIPRDIASSKTEINAQGVVVASLESPQLS